MGQIVTDRGTTDEGTGGADVSKAGTGRALVSAETVKWTEERCRCVCDCRPDDAEEAAAVG